MRAKIPGRENTDVSSLFWASADRLIGAGLEGLIYDVSWEKLSLTNRTHSLGGAVWQIAGHSKRNAVAAACDDGVLRIFSLDGSTISLDFALQRVDGKLLCASWHSSGSTLFTGSSEGIVRRYDVKQHHAPCTLHITLDSFGDDSTLVWKILVLNDYTIVTGDSVGHVQFWDGRRGSGELLQTFNEHTADVTALATNAAEDAVFACGVDNKLIRIEKDAASKWYYCSNKRPHSHDVNALAVGRVMKGSSEIVISGGVDAILCWCRSDSFADGRPRKVYPYPSLGEPVVSISPIQRVAMVQHDDRLDFWRIPRKARTL